MEGEILGGGAGTFNFDGTSGGCDLWGMGFLRVGLLSVVGLLRGVGLLGVVVLLGVVGLLNVVGLLRRWDSCGVELLGGGNSKCGGTSACGGTSWVWHF